MLDEVGMMPIQALVPESMHTAEDILLAQHFEAEASFHEVEGKFVRAAESLDQAIVMRRSILGEFHPEIHAAVERYVCMCNRWSVQLLDAGQHGHAGELLKRAEIMTKSGSSTMLPPRICAATFNNLCCYYRTRGKLSAAMQSLEQALRIVRKHKTLEGSTLIHINYAALLSFAHRHEDALQNLDCVITGLAEEDVQPQHTFESYAEAIAAKRNLAELLAIAYHNMWIELDYLRRHRAAVDCIQQATNIARLRLGKSHVLTLKMEGALDSAQGQFTQRSGPVVEQNLQDTCGSGAPRFQTLLNTDSGGRWTHRQGQFKSAMDELA